MSPAKDHDECLICLEDNDEESVILSCCDKEWHKVCLLHWWGTKRTHANLTCPYKCSDLSDAIKAVPLPDEEEKAVEPQPEEENKAEGEVEVQLEVVQEEDKKEDGGAGAEVAPEKEKEADEKQPQ